MSSNSWNSRIEFLKDAALLEVFLSESLLSTSSVSTTFAKLLVWSVLPRIGIFCFPHKTSVLITAVKARLFCSTFSAYAWDSFTLILVLRPWIIWRKFLAASTDLTWLSDVVFRVFQYYSNQSGVHEWMDNDCYDHKVLNRRCRTSRQAFYCSSYKEKRLAVWNVQWAFSFSRHQLMKSQSLQYLCQNSVHYQHCQLKQAPDLDIDNKTERAKKEIRKKRIVDSFVYFCITCLLYTSPSPRD